MYQVDASEQVRELCQQILDAKDPQRVEELTAELRNLLHAENEEARLRMSFLARHYSGHLRDVLPTGESQVLSQRGMRLRALLNFLGIGGGMSLGREMES